jgi:hypothetical protein
LRYPPALKFLSWASLTQYHIYRQQLSRPDSLAKCSPRSHALKMLSPSAHLPGPPNTFSEQNCTPFSCVARGQNIIRPSRTIRYS